MKITIYWEAKCTPSIKERIINRFNIPNYTTVNGETPCEIKEEDMRDLLETENKGYIQIRNKL